VENLSTQFYIIFVIQKEYPVKEKEYFKYLNSANEERLRMIIRTEKGKVIDLVVQYETQIKTHWKPVVRYDCAHGFFHRDIMSPDGSKEKKSLAIHDLDTALDYAEQDIKDHWEFYKEKYIKQLKK
jgi:hypothetical protein